MPVATITTMGTVASLHVAPGGEEAVRICTDIFAALDADFSLYREQSPLSRLARGELTLEDAPVRVRDEYARAVMWRAATGGAFTPHRPDGVLDLSGTIKAVALADAAVALADHGHRGLLGIGGDLVVVGAGDPDAVIGVVDPDDSGRLLASVVLDGRSAVATSGSAERGDHIWTRAGDTDIRQVTVLADDIVTADVLATAIVAEGSAGLDRLTDGFDVDVLAVTRDGLLATPGLRRRLASPAV